MIHKPKTPFSTAGAAVLLFVATACNRYPAPTDTPTSGSITISVDEAFSQITEAEVNVFESVYERATIRRRYVSEQEAFKDLLNDTARLIIVSRGLTADEVAFFERKKLHPTTVKVATDAVALLVHRDNKDSLLTLAQLKDIVSGKITRWEQLSATSQQGDIKLVFDGQTSGTARYLRENLSESGTLPALAFAAEKSSAVVDYVAQDKNTLGVIGVNWVSDTDDTQVRGFLSRVRVVAVQPREGEDFNKPYQAYIATGDYPLRRDVYIISREARSGLGTGFASFVAGDKGQRIILKSGLVPATAPVRIVELK